VEWVAIGTFYGLHSRRRDGFGRDPKRQFLDDEPPERITGDIHTLPKRRGAKQNTAASLRKSIQQPMAGVFPLYEEWPFPVRSPDPQ